MYSRKKVSYFFIFFIAAAIIAPDLVFALRDSTTVGSVAGNVQGVASILIRVMWAACIIVGIVLIITAFSQFQVHRQNPKLVPLGTPATYLLLALVALGIPFAERITGYMDAFVEEDQMAGKSPYSNIDRGVGYSKSRPTPPKTSNQIDKSDRKTR